jgi:fructose-1,6-bisphosphatase/inositol monophosphatase family enzyme
LANVACGRFDAFFEEGSWDDNTGPKIWDLSAGKLLIEEAGGVTRDVTNRMDKDTKKPMDILQRSSFVAATPELADQILEIMYNST